MNLEEVKIQANNLKESIERLKLRQQTKEGRVECHNESEFISIVQALDARKLYLSQVDEAFEFIKKVNNRIKYLQNLRQLNHFQQDELDNLVLTHRIITTISQSTAILIHFYSQQEAEAWNEIAQIGKDNLKWLRFMFQKIQHLQAELKESNQLLSDLALSLANNA